MFKHKKIVSILVLAAILLALLPAAGFAETLDTAGGNTTETVTEGNTETTPSEGTDLGETDNDVTGSEENGSETDTNLPTDNETGNNNSDSNTDNTENNNAAADDQTETKNENTTVDKTENVLTAPALLSAGNTEAKTYRLTVIHELVDAENNVINVRFTKHDVVEGAEFTSKELAVHENDWVLQNPDASVEIPLKNHQLKLQYTMDNVVYTEKTDPMSEPYKIRTENGNIISAYCYNENLANPGNGNVPYHLGQLYTGQEDKDLDLVSAILLAGYPYDAFGLRAEYGITEDRIAFGSTQYVLWYVLDANQASINAFTPYMVAIYNKASEIAGKPYNKGELHLSTDEESLNFVEQEDGSFATEPVTLYGYDGNFTFTTLPDGVQVYDAADGQPIDLTTKQLTTRHRLIFKSTAQPNTAQKLIAAYTYHYPNEIRYYEAFSNGLKDALEKEKGKTNTDLYKDIFQYQNLLAFEDAEDTVTASFPITVTIKSTPLEPAEPIPDPTPDVPDNNGGGGSEDYTPDTPDTPNTPDTPSTPSEPSVPAETIIPDEATPLAPAPEIVPETEAEVTLDEEPVPLAQTAPISDNPKTGHSVNVIFILQACLLLAAAALLLHDLRQYKKAQ